jgi:hypothetical protein
MSSKHVIIPSWMDAIKLDHGQLKHELNSIVGLFLRPNNRGIFESIFYINVYMQERRGAVAFYYHWIK